MAEFFSGNAKENKTGLAEQGIKFGISAGRRAPMHIMHADCIREITEAGLTPIILIGSTNGPKSPKYDPLRNPMTIDQQKVQLKEIMPGLDIDAHVMTMDDVGNAPLWSDALSKTINRTRMAGKSVVHYRPKPADANASGPIKTMDKTSEELIKCGLPAWASSNENPADYEINASEMRTFDLENLTPEQRRWFVLPDYIIGIVKDARERNPSKDKLAELNIPLTVLDLTFDRLQNEAGVTTESIIAAAEAQGAVTLESLTEATKAAITQLNEQSKIPAPAKPDLQVKVASASLNQTIVNFTRNVPNIKTAIDKAIEDKADVLSLQELVLTGYTGDDNFKWIRSDKQQAEMIELLQEIANYAKERDPNLVLSVGFPFFYSDKKNQPVKLNLGSEEKPILVDNPLYNINNKPFNAVATISGGKIKAISAKTIQPEGAAEYEARQFQPWPDYLGVRNITLCNGDTVPFGKVVMQLGNDKEKCATLYHEICAEAWPGLADDGTVNKKEQEAGRYLSHLAKTHSISLVLNPSASKPEPYIDKAGLRKKLCESGSQITGGGYVYTNCSGLEAAPVAFEGGSIFANKGELSHRSARYDMHEVSYSSDVMSLPVPIMGKPHVVIEHEFRAHEPNKKIGESAAWEKSTGDVRAYEETVRDTLLWIRDYLQKTPGQQGFFISLSGGQDSAYGAVVISQMIDENINQLTASLGSKEKAVAAFVDQFQGLKYADEVKRITQADGAELGIDYLKKQMLTCAYFPSENSSRATRDAANFLINGGVRIDVKDKEHKGETLSFYLDLGEPDNEKDRIIGSTLFHKKDNGSYEEYEIVKQHDPVKGIGGTLHIMPIQDIVDSYLEIYASVDKTGLTAEVKEQLSAEIRQCVSGKLPELSSKFKDKIKRGLLSWNNKANDISLQNLQARVREPLALLFGNDENKIACVTSNLSEAVAGYWTFGGDGHMGTINLLGGIFKSDLRQLLKYLETIGLGGTLTVPSLHLVNQNKASAELRPLKDGEIEQFDEDDMMPYEALDAITRKIILGKNSPVEAYKQLLKEKPTYTDGKTPIFADAKQLVANIEQWCWRWDASQFKRVAAVTTPFLGQNVDPHGSVRTTIFSDMFKNGRAALKLEYLKDKLGGEEAFEKEFGKAFSRALLELKISGAFRTSVIKSSVDVAALTNAVQTHQNSPQETAPGLKGLAI